MPDRPASAPDVPADRISLDEAARAALELNPHLAWVADATGQMVELSARWLAYTGLPLARCLGTGWAEAIPPEDRDPVGDAWQRALAAGAPFDLVHRMRRVDGDACWVHTRAHPWRHPDGAIRAWFGWTEDIHRRVVAEEEQARFALAARGAVDGLWSWDAATNGARYSARYRELLGYTADEFPDTMDAFYRVLHPDDRAHHDAAVRAHFAHRTPLDMQVRIRHRDGSWRWFSDRGQAEWDADGRPIRMAGSISDITARHAAEGALRASEARYRALLRHYPDGAVFLVDHDLRFLVADGQALREAGFDPALVVGRRLAEVVGEESAGRLTPHYRAALAGEERSFTIDSAGRTYEGEATPVRDLEGRVVAGMVVTRDVTLQVEQAQAVQRALAEARASEARFRASFDAMPGSMAVLDPVTGRFVDFNDTACTELGYARAEFAALTLADVDVDAPEGARLLRESVATGARRQLARRYRSRDGAVHDVLVTTRPFDVDGRTFGYCTWLDVTEQRRREVERARLGEELQRLLGAMREGVYGMDDRGRITFANPAAAGALGTTPDAMVGQRAHALIHHTRDDGSPYPLDECPIHRALRAGEGARVQHEVFWRADGQPLPVEYTVEPIRDADGTILGSVVLFTDVSAHLAAERERSALEEQLRQAQKMEAVGQLAGGVAHDFNNLLTVIGANLEFAREGLDADHPVRADLDEVEAAADRARALVRQLLLFSRRQPLQQRALRLDEVVRQAERLLRRVIGEEIVLSTALDDGGAAIRADAGQLEQLLVNLAVNARDAMLTPLHGHAGTGGTLEIATDVVTLHPSEARAWSGVAPGRWVRLRVRDTGHGMDTETREHVFEPFFTTKEVGRGTGLGLATVFGVVRQMGGGIRVDSAPGLGTTFTILLPAAAPAEATAAPAFPADAPPRAGGTVLLVEDESAVRLTARRILMRAGYVVLEARHGADALAIWQRHRGEVDAVVTDVRMPEMGGPALVARLQADRADVPVVFMSGYVDEGTRLVQGAHETFLEKPFTADGLLDAVARVTAVAAARRPDGAADR